MTNLQTFVSRIVERDYGGVYQRLADDLALSLSALMRALKNGTFSAENCLMLAKVTGTPPSKVLTLAGKGDTAKLIETLYGQPNTPLSTIDQRLLSLTTEQKRAVLLLADRS